MGRSLYDTRARLPRVIDECADAAHAWLGCDLRDVMFGRDAARLERTQFAQPAIYAAELGLAALWQSWGIVPAAMLGHSLGEYVAATLAGVWTLVEGLRLVCTRGRMMQGMEAGAMLSVALGEAELAAYAGEGLAVAALNAPRASVLSGSFAAIDAVEARLRAGGVATRRLRTSHAFHSKMMQPMVAEFEREVAKVKLRAPRLRFVSSVTGEWITVAQATSPRYWAQQCVQPVRFAQAVALLASDTLLEVGEGETLATLAIPERRAFRIRFAGTRQAHGRCSRRALEMRRLA